MTSLALALVSCSVSLGGVLSLRHGGRACVLRASGEAELLEHQRLVPLLPALLHPAVRHAIHDETIERDRLARRRRGTEWSRMSAARPPPERHAVALDQLILDRQVQVGKCA